MQRYQDKVQTYGYDIILLLSFFLYFFAARAWRGSSLSTLMFHAAFLLIAFLVLPKSEKQKDFWMWFFLILVIEVGLPFIVYKTEILMQNKWVTTYLINPQITMGWFYFAVIRSEARTLITKIARLVVILIWIAVALSFISTAFTFEDVSTMVTPDMLAKAEAWYVQAGKWWWDVAINFQKVLRQGTEYFKNRMRLVTGDYYTGTVDENQYETLGVFLKDLQATDPQFYLGEPITVWATLEAKTLEDGLTIDINCYHGKEDKETGVFPESQGGEEYPAEIPLIFDEEQIDIDCRFPNSHRNGMVEGSNPITIQADFNFETMAYLKTYFIDKDRLRSMERQGIDPLEEYGIEDKDPKARYTNGPVRIGMGTDDAPIGINDAYSVKPRLGITLDTNEGWQGKIKQIEELVIMLPKTMSLDTLACPEFYEIKEDNYIESCQENYRKYRTKQFYECVKEVGLDKEENVNAIGDLIGSTQLQRTEFDKCTEEFCKTELENYRAYNLSINENNKQFYSNIGYDSEENEYKTFSCRINLDEPQNILGDVPISTQYFRVKARYTYEIEESINVDIEKGKDFWTIYDKPDPPKSSDIAGQISYIFTEYYMNEPYSIKNYCQDSKSQLLGDEKKCACLAMSIMAIESNGNVDVQYGDDGKSYFLMQIMKDTAEGVWNKYNLDSCNLDEIDCNIMSAIYYLKEAEDTGKTEGKPENYAAYYNCGPKALYEVADCNGVSKLNWECPQVYNSQEKQCISDGSDTTRLVYVPYVMERYKYCIDTDLMSTSVIKETEIKVNTGTMALGFTENKTEIQALVTDTPYLIIAKKVDEEITARVYYAYKKDSKVISKFVLTSTLTLVSDTEIYDEDYPLIKLNLNQAKDSISYSYLGKSYSEAVTLVEDQKTYIGTEEVDYHTNAIPGWIDAYYEDDEIRLFDTSGKTNSFCTVPWSQYEDRVDGKCQEEKLFNVRVINKQTIEDSETISDRAAVQIQYDPEYEHPCCSDCKSCNALTEPGLFCASCNNCEPESTVSDLDLDLDADTIICKGEGSGTAENSGTDTGTKTEKPDCCDTCTGCSENECKSCGNCVYMGDTCVKFEVDYDEYI